MSRALIVDDRYRLRPEDLLGAPLRVSILSVSYQGLEHLTPVLHFANTSAKPLALTPGQRRELIRLTRSSIFSDWIGRTVELRLTMAESKPAIEIAAPTPPAVVREQFARLRSNLRLHGRTWLLLTLLLLVFTLLYLLENSETVWQAMLKLFR
jgi:hypothetical protein